MRFSWSIHIYTANAEVRFSKNLWLLVSQEKTNVSMGDGYILSAPRIYVSWLQNRSTTLMSGSVKTALPGLSKRKVLLKTKVNLHSSWALEPMREVQWIIRVMLHQQDLREIVWLSRLTRTSRNISNLPLILRITKMRIDLKSTKFNRFKRLSKSHH